MTKQRTRTTRNIAIVIFVVKKNGAIAKAGCRGLIIIFVVINVIKNGTIIGIVLRLVSNYD